MIDCSYSDFSTIMKTSSTFLQTGQLCRVCGEIAAGFHFGAFTCEGCKSFFGRSFDSKKTLVADCKTGGNCEITGRSRTACKLCRFKKCLLVGMSKSGSRYGRRSNWFKLHCILQQNDPHYNSRNSSGRGKVKSAKPPEGDIQLQNISTTSESPGDPEITPTPTPQSPLYKQPLSVLHSSPFRTSFPPGINCWPRALVPLHTIPTPTDSYPPRLQPICSVPPAGHQSTPVSVIKMSPTEGRKIWRPPVDRNLWDESPLDLSLKSGKRRQSSPMDLSSRK